jgi:hypothetical protein
MTNSRNYRNAAIIIAVTTISFVVFSSWNFQPFTFQTIVDWQVTDTVPKKDNREKKIRDLDDVLNELNAADLKIDIEKMQRELKDAMKKIDTEKMKLEIEKSLKEVDFQKIQKEVESSMAKVMKEIDAAKIQMEIQQSLEKIDWDKMKTEFEKVKEIEMPKLELEMQQLEKELSKIGPEIEKSLDKAKMEIEKAKAEMKEYNDFVNGLEKDGLLNRKEGYTIRHKDGELFINGKKASAAIYNKYRRFLEKHKEFKIDKSDGDFNIDIN